jgi:hypothetical protein
MKPEKHIADRNGLQGFSTNTVRLDQTKIDRAKAVPIADEVSRRGGLNLKRNGHELTGACPRCGGDDRFSVNIVKRCFNCRRCLARGDVIAFVMHVDGVGFTDAVQTLAGNVERGIIKPVPITRPPPDPGNKNGEIGLRLFFHEAGPIGGTIAERYLQERRKLVELPDDSVIRFHPSCYFEGERHPSLLALCRDIVTNRPKAVMRTALRPDGTKIDRMGLGPIKGAAVKIDDDAHVTQGLTIGEGLESVLAARQLGFKPAWSLGSAGAIAAFPVLSGIEALTILVDNDPADMNGRRAGQDATAKCWGRWSAAGCEVQAFTASIEGCDIADIIDGGEDE